MKIKSVLFFLMVFAAGSGLFAADIEVGALGGVAVWEDTVSVSGAPEMRWLFALEGKPFVAGLGAQARYNFTSYDGYTQNEVLAYALASVDYPLIPRLSLRAPAALGGGWLGADGGEGASMGAFAVRPAAGVMYEFKPVSVFLLAGSELVIVEDATKKTITVDLGATWRFRDSRGGSDD